MTNVVEKSQVPILGLAVGIIPEKEIPATINIDYLLLGATREANWDPGKNLGYEGGVKSALKRRAPGMAKDTSGVAPHPNPNLFVTDQTAIPGFRLIYVHPHATVDQKNQLLVKLSTPPKDSPTVKLVEIPNPALMQLVWFKPPLHFITLNVKIMSHRKVVCEFNQPIN